MRSGNTRTSRLYVRLTDDEHGALATQAEAAGLTISQLVRQRCLSDDEKPRIVVDTETLRALYRDQRRIGGLLNQLLRHANSRHQDFPELITQAQEVLEQLEETSVSISQFIADARHSA